MMLSRQHLIAAITAFIPEFWEEGLSEAAPAESTGAERIFEIL